MCLQQAAQEGAIVQQAAQEGAIVVIDVHECTDFDKDAMWDQMLTDDVVGRFCRPGSLLDKDTALGSRGNVEWMYECTNTRKPRLMFDLQAAYPHIRL